MVLPARQGTVPDRKDAPIILVGERVPTAVLLTCVLLGQRSSSFHRLHRITSCTHEQRGYRYSQLYQVCVVEATPLRTHASHPKSMKALLLLLL